MVKHGFFFLIIFLAIRVTGGPEEELFCPEVVLADALKFNLVGTPIIIFNQSENKVVITDEKCELLLRFTNQSRDKLEYIISDKCSSLSIDWIQLNFTGSNVIIIYCIDGEIKKSQEKFTGMFTMTKVFSNITVMNVSRIEYSMGGSNWTACISKTEYDNYKKNNRTDTEYRLANQVKDQRQRDSLKEEIKIAKWVFDLAISLLCLGYPLFLFCGFAIGFHVCHSKKGEIGLSEWIRNLFGQQSGKANIDETSNNSLSRVVCGNGQNGETTDTSGHARKPNRTEKSQCWNNHIGEENNDNERGKLLGTRGSNPINCGIGMRGTRNDDPSMPPSAEVKEGSDLPSPDGQVSVHRTTAVQPTDNSMPANETKTYQGPPADARNEPVFNAVSHSAIQ